MVGFRESDNKYADYCRVHMEGIEFLRKDDYSLVNISSFSSELRDAIRSHLSSICHGDELAASGRKMYNYECTLATFLDRYATKTDAFKIGMVGELLAHILIVELFDEFETVSPYFNLEEKHIKKGFDILLYEKNENEVWITEVKSGQLHQGKNSTETTKVLLSTARSDLNKRLNENELNHWQNAINAARSAIKDKSDYKKSVMAILMDEGDLVHDEAATSSDNNVFLVSALFSEEDERVEEEMIFNFCKDLERRKLFKKSVVLSAKKSAFEAVVEFLKSEISDD